MLAIAVLVTACAGVLDERAAAALRVACERAPVVDCIELELDGVVVDRAE